MGDSSVIDTVEYLAHTSEDDISVRSPQPLLRVDEISRWLTLEAVETCF